jgi:hypothetical protein
MFGTKSRAKVRSGSQLILDVNLRNKILALKPLTVWSHASELFEERQTRWLLHSLLHH